MRKVLALLLGLALAPAAGLAAAPTYDVVIRGGRIVDGAGNPWYRADVAIDAGLQAESRRSAVSSNGASAKSMRTICTSRRAGST
jgi:hypothetical protein